MDLSADSRLEDFERWDTPHLKDYLAKRGISQTGKKAELVALAYSCHQMNKPVTETLIPNIEQSFNDYQAILHLPTGITLPDPFKVTSGWIDEGKDGMKYWPPISIVDIVDHFREQHVNSEKLLSEYKAGKAYDYFKTEWLKEIFYNSLNDSLRNYPGVDKLCLLKAKCTPSQRINDPYHDVWLAVENETINCICLLQLCCRVTKSIQ